MKRLLVVGYGDVARRARAALDARFEVTALSRSEGFDLDNPEVALPGPCDALAHLAPPPAAGASDSRTANLLAALERQRIVPGRIVYVSTSGVYGDCGGARIEEDREPNPQSARARRRLDAEQQLALWCKRHDAALVVLRAPGIYAADRLPVARLAAGTPALRAEDDVYTNHIHADDLAAVLARALEEDAPPGLYNVCDDTEMKLGDWLDLVAERMRLPRPPRIARSEATGRIPEELLSFMSESRRLVNRRMKEQLGIRLSYPTVHEGVPRLKEAA